jgi:hypothetical protein
VLRSAPAAAAAAAVHAPVPRLWARAPSSAPTAAPLPSASLPPPAASAGRLYLGPPLSPSAAPPARSTAPAAAAPACRSAGPRHTPAASPQRSDGSDGSSSSSSSSSSRGGRGRTVGADGGRSSERGQQPADSHATYAAPPPATMAVEVAEGDLARLEGLSARPPRARRRRAPAHQAPAVHQPASAMAAACTFARYLVKARSQGSRWAEGAPGPGRWPWATETPCPTKGSLALLGLASPSTQVNHGLCLCCRLAVGALEKLRVAPADWSPAASRGWAGAGAGQGQGQRQGQGQG